MTSHLRRLLQRPLSERDRQRGFALAAAVLMTAALALTLTSNPTGDERPANRNGAALAPAPPIPAADPAEAAPVVPTARTSPPAERASARSRHAPPPRVARAARGFLTGYLRYLYGRGRAGRIDRASTALRRRLAAERLRVPPAARRRRPRLVSLHGERVPERRAWLVTARVDDGDVAVYPVELLIALRRGGPVVERIGGE